MDINEQINKVQIFIGDEPCHCAPEIEIDPEEKKCSRCQALECLDEVQRWLAQKAEGARE